MARALLTLALVTAGCSDTFPPSSLVTDLRVLGVRAEPPEILPEQTARLEALIVDPEGGGYAIAWRACDPALLETDDPERDCAGESALALDADADGAATFDPAAIAAAFGYEEALAKLDGESVARVLVVLTVEGGDKSVTAVKRVAVSRAEARNRNPVVDAAFAPACLGGKDDPIAPAVPIESFEVADKKRAVEVEGHETIEVRLYADAGRFDRARLELLWTPEGEPEPDEASWSKGGDAADETRFWAVAYDGRGGVAWREETAAPCR